MENIITYEENEWGRYKVINQTNGVKVRLHREPSDAYKQKMGLKAEQMRIEDDERKEKERKEKLIKDRLRKKALEELKEEGLLPSDYE